ncbi:hypothetical protein QBC34DRAFT_383699 [Podospora aff. communis PSN243]|uniref:Heterokaryon incompatibility domain-containing protein n=1 Tax=Podospora aff. communis PSN243 TaxID=3040156 RepID=A0AAV9GD37_9PEZI|nr:hypothetical protein QBC34DRAFT_383699 [Podospora aff. communis PSN243]
MDRLVDPITAKYWEFTWSTPLFRFGDAEPVADTGIEIFVLILSRYWVRSKRGPRPARKPVRNDALELLASRLLRGFLSAIEAWVIDRLLPPSASTFMRTFLMVHATHTATQRITTRGSMILNDIGCFASLNFAYPNSYVMCKRDQHAVLAFLDIFLLLRRLVRRDLGNDLLQYLINPTMAIIFGLTTCTIWALDNDVHSALGIFGITVVGFAIILAVWYPAFLFRLMTRLPDANAYGVKRAAQTLAGTVPHSMYEYRSLQEGEIRLLQLMPRNSLREDVVVAELITVSLNSMPDYDCMSYAWGDPSTKKDSYILVNEVANRRPPHFRAVGWPRLVPTPHANNTTTTNGLAMANSILQVADNRLFQGGQQEQTGRRKPEDVGGPKWPDFCV